MTRRIALAGALVLGSFGGLTAQSTAPVDSLALARQYTQWLYAGEADSLVAHSTDRAKTGFASREGWIQSSDRIHALAGIELAVIEETWKLRNGACQYYRRATFSNTEQEILVRWILTKDGLISGLGLGPAMQAPPFDREDCGPPPRR